MTKLVVLTLFILSSTLYAQSEPMPGENTNGYKNINSRSEYGYEKYPNETIWSEGGRPYWKKGNVNSKKRVSNRTSSIKDHDGDGVRDEYDRCPETKSNMLVNQYGCELKKNEKVTLDVKFNTGKDTLNNRYTSNLDRLAKILKKNKSLVLEIQGHTDGSGNRDFNLNLSERRSKNVVKYLTETHGIERGRLRPKGYGPDKPIAENKTKYGRQQNRRVEVKVLKN